MCVCVCVCLDPPLTYALLLLLFILLVVVVVVGWLTKDKVVDFTFYNNDVNRCCNKQMQQSTIFPLAGHGGRSFPPEMKI